MRCNLTLIMHKNVYSDFNNYIKSENKNNIGRMIKEANEIIENNNFISISWEYIKFNISFDEYRELFEYLDKIDKEYENEKNLSDTEAVKKYGYELLIVYEDGSSEFRNYTIEYCDSSDIGMPELSCTTIVHNAVKKDYLYKRSLQ